MYDEIYQTIETQILPHFLSFAEANINKPKQLFWYVKALFETNIQVPRRLHRHANRRHHLHAPNPHVNP